MVALESTVIAHGLPRPRNLEIALELEEIVRRAGAVPATIAVIDGIARIGLAREELIALAEDDRFEKLSARDLPVAIARRSNGATTVAATAFLAAGAGIPVFATGGIGGVHRGQPLDVSADLTQLRRTRIIVVCAGAKSILDLPATREVLETLGILVLGWGTDRFPAFYVSTSDLSVDARVDSAAEVAAVWDAHARLGTGSALLVCAPVPAMSELPAREVERVVAAALRQAEVAGIQGKAITPFLLAQVAAATGGASLEANIALLRNNVAIAASIAQEVEAR